MHLIDLSVFDIVDLERRLLKHLPNRSCVGCWPVEDLWRDKDGYPILCVGRRRLRANRIAHHVWNGPIPAGALVLHACDNPPCARPDHLSAGTASRNALDREEKRRRAVLSERRQIPGQLDLLGAELA